MWLWVVIFAYFLNAIATLISKWLLIRTIPNPVVFTFYIGVLNLVALILIPFGFYVPGFLEILLALISGASFAWGMYIMVKALHIDQASQVAPMIGGLQPIFVLLFAWWFLPEQLNISQYFGIGLLIIGSILIALEIGRKRLFTESLYMILGSSFLFGLSFALLRLVYVGNDFIAGQNFVTGFVWSRIGTFLFVFLLVMLPGNWQKVKNNFKKTGEKVKGLFIFGQILGAVSFLLIAYAISLGPVSVINSLQGVQYALLFLMIVWLVKRRPHLLDEPLTRPIIIQKVIAILVIIVGLAFVIK